MANFVAVDYCDRHPSARATYISMRDDVDLTFCDHCTKRYVDALVEQGFSVVLIPGVRQAVAANG